MLNRYLSLAICFGIVASASGQFSKKAKRSTHKQATHRIKKPFDERKYTCLGFSVNAMNYYGDLSPRPSRFSTDLKFTRPSFELSVSHKYGPNFSVQARFLTGMLQGDDEESSNPNDKNGRYRYRRNASFRNSIKEFSVISIFEFPSNHGFYMHRHQVTYYLFAGFGVFYNNPKAKAPSHDLAGNPLPEAGKWVDLQPLGTEGQFSNLKPTDANFGIKPYSRVQPCIPVGIGLRYRVNHTVDFWIDYSFRYLFTDYIDDVSRNYVDLGVLNNDLARTFSYRGHEIGPSQLHTYVGRDGQQYVVQPGYGSEHPDNKRGSPKDKDIFTVFSLRISKIINANMHKAKSR
jgi:hypothetical protein